MRALNDQQLTKLQDYVQELKKELEIATERSLTEAQERIDTAVADARETVDVLDHNLNLDITKLRADFLDRLHQVHDRLRQLEQLPPGNLADKITDLAVRTTAQIANKTDAIRHEIKRTEQRIQTNLHTIDARTAADLSQLSARLHDLEARVPRQPPTNPAAQSAALDRELAQAFNTLLTIQNRAWYEAHKEQTKPQNSSPPPDPAEAP